MQFPEVLQESIASFVDCQSNLELINISSTDSAILFKNVLKGKDFEAQIATLQRAKFIFRKSR